jgi:hypothetical protein
MGFTLRFINLQIEILRALRQDLEDELTYMVKENSNVFDDRSYVYDLRDRISVIAKQTRTLLTTK